MTPIPVIDFRGVTAAAAADPARVQELRDAVFGPFRAIALPILPVADRIARAWLARTASPYLAELDALAVKTRCAGIYAINISYEYACTVYAQADAPGRSPTLRRTLDWPFLGLGKRVIVARREGPAGEFYDVTWPGAVGTLTALAPGRFAAAINQAPLLRRTTADFLRPLDYTRNLARTLSRERGMPPLHLLRSIFENAPSFCEALERLQAVEIARPVLITLVGLEPEEIAVIERCEREATVHFGPGPVANDWRVPRPGWEPRPCALPDRRLDSVTRCAAIESSLRGCREPFAWVVPPVRNWNTRLAVEMSPGDGSLRVQGYEPISPADAAPATAPFERTFEPVARRAA